jgi:hypothetical protein
MHEATCHKRRPVPPAEQDHTTPANCSSCVGVSRLIPGMSPKQGRGMCVAPDERRRQWQWRGSTAPPGDGNSNAGTNLVQGACVSATSQPSRRTQQRVSPTHTHSGSRPKTEGFVQPQTQHVQPEHTRTRTRSPIHAHSPQQQEHPKKAKLVGGAGKTGPNVGRLAHHINTKVPPNSVGPVSRPRTPCGCLPLSHLPLPHRVSWPPRILTGPITSV